MFRFLMMFRILCLGFVLFPFCAAAQDAQMPLEITADTAIEWHRTAQKFVARGRAQAMQGTLFVQADTLTAFYNSAAAGGLSIRRLEARGTVRIRSGGHEGQSDVATYDLQTGLAVMEGESLEIRSPDQTITARERFEYDVPAGTIRALGDARIIRADATLEAPEITAVLVKDDQGKQVLETLTAQGGVIITTPTEILTGDMAIYRARTNSAEIEGGVRIQRGESFLEGARADVNLTTQISRIFGQTGDSRVRGVFYPEQ